MDNWCGISLLDVVGKVMASTVKEKLEQITDRTLPESQCGFRKGRGCVDMILLLDSLWRKLECIIIHCTCYLLT